MKIIKSPAEMQAWSRAENKTLGFIPTMGALHAGHQALIERARKENERVAVSIYVNPTQFGEGEDFERYPRTFDADKKLCEKAGVDCIFAPDNLYGKGALTWVEVGVLGDPLCGLSRPGHFRGVATVVAKLFNIVSATRAYFGRKDAQQLLVIQTMVRDLNFPIEIVPCDIVREPDGLAMSSRNRYLSAKERKQALSLSRALEHCKTRISKGERDALALMGEMATMIMEEPDAEIDYVSIVDAHTLDDLEKIKGDVLAAVAVKFGKTRLIDNEHFEGLK